MGISETRGRGVSCPAPGDTESEGHAMTSTHPDCTSEPVDCKTCLKKEHGHYQQEVDR